MVGQAANDAETRKAECYLDEVFAETIALFEDNSQSWSPVSSEGGIVVTQKAVFGASFPIYRATLRVVEAEARSTSLIDIAAIVCSASCRRFYDLTFDRGTLLKSCGQSAAVVGLFNKGTPVTSASLWVAVLGARRSNVGTTDDGERLTVVMGKAPDDVRASVSEPIAAAGGEGVVMSSMRLWSFDIVRLEDGTLRLGLILHIERNLSWLPAFVINRFLAKQPAMTLGTVWKMARTGLIPRSVVTLTEDEPQGRMEVRTIAGDRVFVSTVCCDALTA